MFGGDYFSNAVDVYEPSLITAYCTAKVGASGTPAMSVFGCPSIANAAGFFIVAGPANTNKPGLLIYSPSGCNNHAFQGGTLCIGTSGLRRCPAVNSGGTSTCDGEFLFNMNAFAANQAGGSPQAFLSTVGPQVNVQWWGRDSLATGSFLSNGLEYTVVP